MAVRRTMKLCDAPVGSRVRVTAVATGEHGQGRRLEDLGLVAGTVVVVERHAPLGDPTIYEVRRARLAIRRIDAGLVEVTDDAATVDDDATVDDAATVDGGGDVAL